MRLSRLDTSAPSSTLLKFLRSQSENLCFSTFNAKPGLCHHPPRRGFSVHSGSKQTRASASSRLIIRDVQRPKAVEAIRLKLDLVRSPFTLRNSTALPPSRVTPSSLIDGCAGWKQQSRHASTSSHAWLRRLWDFKSRGGQAALKPDDLPPLTSFLDEGAESSMFNLGRSLAGKASNELKLRCTEFDENGNVTLVNGEFKKSELIAKVSVVLSYSIPLA